MAILQGVFAVDWQALMLDTSQLQGLKPCMLLLLRRTYSISA